MRIKIKKSKKLRFKKFIEYFYSYDKDELFKYEKRSFWNVMSLI